MDYPLNMQLAAPEIGFAVASDEAEHIALSDIGYLPAFPGHEQAPADPVLRTELLSKAEILGVKVNGRWGDKRLAEEIAKAEQAPADPVA